MKRTVYHRLVYLLLFLSVLIIDSRSQNYFIIEKPGTIHNFKFQVNDVIKLKAGPKGEIIEGRIYKIADSSITIGYYYTLHPEEIQVLYKQRFGFFFLQRVLFFMGVPYLAISAFNGIINSDSPMVSKNTWIISSSLIGASLALTPFTTREIKVDNKHWRAKILYFGD